MDWREAFGSGAEIWGAASGAGGGGVGLGELTAVDCGVGCLLETCREMNTTQGNGNLELPANWEAAGWGWPLEKNRLAGSQPSPQASGDGG
jgi:hypothetical protein